VSRLNVIEVGTAQGGQGAAEAARCAHGAVLSEDEIGCRRSEVEMANAIANAMENQGKGREETRERERQRGGGDVCE
jgi:hypothetical protein